MTENILIDIYLLFAENHSVTKADVEEILLKHHYRHTSDLVGAKYITKNLFQSPKYYFI